MWIPLRPMPEWRKKRAIELLPQEAEQGSRSEALGSRRAPRIRLAASATDKADEEAEAQADADGGKWIALDGAAGLSQSVGHGVLRALVLARCHIANAVAEVLDVVADVFDVRSLVSESFRLRLSASSVIHEALLEGGLKMASSRQRGEALE
jgi:hypothetical protein